MALCYNLATVILTSLILSQKKPLGAVAYLCYCFSVDFKLGLIYSENGKYLFWDFIRFSKSIK